MDNEIKELMLDENILLLKVAAFEKGVVFVIGAWGCVNEEALTMINAELDVWEEEEMLVLEYMTEYYMTATWSREVMGDYGGVEQEGYFELDIKKAVKIKEGCCN